MKIATDNETIEVFLEWFDIECLKEGNAVAERYNGEHKFNLSVTAESFLAESWIDTDGMLHTARFDTYLHDFFVELPMFDICNSFIRSNTIVLPRNPLFEKVKIVYP